MKDIKVWPKDLMVDKPYVEIIEVKNLENDNDNCIRVYCTQAPDVFNFQIRTFKPITERWNRKKGKERNMIASVSLTLTELEGILEYCKSIHPNMKRVNTEPLHLLSQSDES